VKLGERARSVFRVQQYAARESIAGVELHELRRHRDDGGSLVELLRLSGPAVAGIDGFALAQVSYASIQPGVVKAFHLHQQQTDVWFVRPEDRLLVVLVDARADSSSADRRLRLLLGDGQAALLRIPPGVAHGCRNLGARPASLVYFTDRHFSAEPDTCDEGRLPWDWAGREVWDVAWE
jgi:dTDP-4-dehydrorhamnose 3,5-epimerase